MANTEDILYEARALGIYDKVMRESRKLAKKHPHMEVADRMDKALIKEKYNMSDKQVDNILEKLGMSQLDFLSEQTEWFVTKDRQLSPGIYRVREEKVLNKTCDDVVKAKDKIRIEDNCFPVNDLFGIDIYEAIHLPTRQTIYVTASEIYK